MSNRGTRLLIVASIIVASTGSVRTQHQAQITQAIEQLGSESPQARAIARKAILNMGKPGLTILRQAIAAGDEISPEQLFVIAEDIGGERRSLRFARSWDLGESGTQPAARSKSCSTARRRRCSHSHGQPTESSSHLRVYQGQ